GTIVNETLVGAGQLRLQNLNPPGTDPDPIHRGFSVLNEFLTLNGDGNIPGVNFPTADIGALTNVQGNNIWAGPVTLGSPAPTVVGFASIGAAPSTILTISGVISSPNQAYTLNKVDTGKVVLNNANTYTGVTNVQEGILNVRDSNALGATGAGT